MKHCSNNAKMRPIEVLALALNSYKDTVSFLHPLFKDKKKLKLLGKLSPDYIILLETLWKSDCDCYSRVDITNNHDYFRIQLIRDYITNENGYWRISDIFLLSAKKTISKAICHLTFQNKDNPPILNPLGYVLFETIETISGPTVKISGRITGLLPNKNHAIHIHRTGNMSDSGGCCMATCDHYNPTGQFHGGRNDIERHIGDLGNLKTDKNGEVEFSFKDNRINLDGDYSIVGRSIVIHMDPDDNREGGFPDSHTTGHAGKRIVCGVIGIMEEI